MRFHEAIFASPWDDVEVNYGAALCRGGRALPRLATWRSKSTRAAACVSANLDRDTRREDESRSAAKEMTWSPPTKAPFPPDDRECAKDFLAGCEDISSATISAAIGGEKEA